MELMKPALCEILGVEVDTPFHCLGGRYKVKEDGILYRVRKDGLTAANWDWGGLTPEEISRVIEARWKGRGESEETIKLTPDEEAVYRILCGAGFIAIKRDEDGGLIGTFLDGSAICRAHYVSISKLFPSLRKESRDAQRDENNSYF